MLYLLSCIAMAVAALAIDLIDDLRLRAKLKQLAAKHRLHFFAGDRFNFAGPVARRFPIIGVAGPEVGDLIYGRRDDRYYYIFRFDYTIGVTGRKQRRRAIVAFSEPTDRACASGTSLHVAAQDCGVTAQYEQVMGAVGVTR